jgi:uncharacterized membrane protein YkvA (DUF1232 family)
MATGIKRWFSFPALVRSVYSNARLATRLVRDPQVPPLLKALPLVGMAYVLLPLDFIPDVLPALGQIDDLAIIMMAMEALRRLAPSHVVAHHEGAIARGRGYSPVTSTKPDYIDAEFRKD